MLGSFFLIWADDAFRTPRRATCRSMERLGSLPTATVLPSREKWPKPVANNNFRRRTRGKGTKAESRKERSSSEKEAGTGTASCDTQARLISWTGAGLGVALACLTALAPAGSAAQQGYVQVCCTRKIYILRPALTALLI